jgi:ketosteroid isomerase-like protein
MIRVDHSDTTPKRRHALGKWIAATLAALMASFAGSSISARVSHAPSHSTNANHALEEIIQAEAQFAKASVEMGTKKSFLRYVAPDGVIFRPRPVPALETLKGDADDSPTEGFLDWWPVMAGVARSGDLGFSVGPWHQHLAIPVSNYPADTYGYYCTVWRRQADGSWKFVIDGAGAFLKTVEPTRVRGSDVRRLAISSDTPIDAGRALHEVQTLEKRLSSKARINAYAASSAHYAPRAWVMGSHVEVVEGAAGWRSELLTRPARLELKYAGGGASAAGDLAYVYGGVESLEREKPFPDATFLHIWMRQNGRWQIVFDGLKQRRSFD